MSLPADRLGWLTAMVLAGLMVIGLVQYAMLHPLPGQADADAVSSATYPADTDVTLPPRGATYKVLGRQEGLRNFVVRYDDRLYRGGQIVSQKGIERLQKWGVRTILSVTPDAHERKYAAAAGLRLVEVPFEKKRAIPKETLEKFLEAVKDHSGPVYLHCMGGSHRAGALAAAYRIHVSGWGFDKASLEFGRLGGSLKDDHKLLKSVRKN